MIYMFRVLEFVFFFFKGKKKIEVMRLSFRCAILYLEKLKLIFVVVFFFFLVRVWLF